MSRMSPERRHVVFGHGTSAGLIAAADKDEAKQSKSSSTRADLGENGNHLCREAANPRLMRGTAAHLTVSRVVTAVPRHLRTC
jgi:hypothetical protein